MGGPWGPGGLRRPRHPKEEEVYIFFYAVRRSAPPPLPGTPDACICRSPLILSPRFPVGMTYLAMEGSMGAAAYALNAPNLASWFWRWCLFRGLLSGRGLHEINHWQKPSGTHV